MSAAPGKAVAAASTGSKAAAPPPTYGGWGRRRLGDRRSMVTETLDAEARKAAQMQEVGEDDLESWLSQAVAAQAGPPAAETMPKSASKAAPHLEAWLSQAVAAQAGPPIAGVAPKS